jgi:hypothetical protein
VQQKDLVVATQGRSFWILDNLSSLYQITPRLTATEVHLFHPRDGYRTRVNPNALGPAIEYYLPAAPAGPVTIEILDPAGKLINSYTSDASLPRGGRGGAGPAGAEPEDPDAPVGRRPAPPPRPTKIAGLNRMVWDVRNQAGVIVPPGTYQARLKIGTTVLTENFNLLIDPRVAADGVTVAILQEQFEHNMRLRELVNRVNQLVNRVRQAQTQLRTTPGADAKILAEVNIVAAKLMTEPVRYGKPGLQAQITYLSGMTANVDQKIGRDAIERYEVLRKELDTIRAEVNRLLGPEPPPNN